MANWERGGKYALSGAAAGAGIGSIVPGWGTAIGAGIGGVAGGLYGLFSDDPEEPVVPGLDADRLRQSNAALADTMEARVRGEGTSPAELQMRAGMDRQRAMAESLAHSGAGAYNPGLARRQALRAQGEAGAQFNADAGILRAQEQAAAEGRLAALLGQDKAMHFGKDLSKYQSDVASDRAMLAGGFQTGGELLALNRNKLGGTTPANDPGYVPSVIGGYYAEGGIVEEPTQAILGEGGRPEAVIPLTSPADAALAATMIDRARMRMDAEQKARALAMLATRLTGGKVHGGSAAGMGEAGQAGARMGDYATMITGGGRPTRADAGDYGRRMGALAARLTEGR